MITKQQLKHYSSLKEKKYRGIYRKIFVEGKRLVSDALKSSYPCEIIIATENFVDRQFDDILAGREVEIVTEKEFKNLSDTETSQGIGAVLHIPKYNEDIHSVKGNRLIYFDGIKDPGNAGTIIRTAAWFGVYNIIIGKTSVDIFNPKVVRSTMGSLFSMNIIEDSLDYTKFFEAKKSGFTVAAAELHGTSIFEYEVPEKMMLLLGSEAFGVDQKLIEFVDASITIPGRGEGESLNVAVAASIILSQFTKV